MFSYFIVSVLVFRLYSTDALECYRCFGSAWCNNYTDPRFLSNVHRIDCPNTNTAYNYDGNSPLMEKILKNLQEESIRLNNIDILNESQWGCVTVTLHEDNEAHTVRTCLNNASSICPAIRNVVLNSTLNDISPDITLDCEGCTDNLCNSQTFVESEQEESSSTTEVSSPSAPSTSSETSSSTTSSSATSEAPAPSAPSTSHETSLSTTSTSSTAEASSPSSSPETSSSTTSTSATSEASSPSEPSTSQETSLNTTCTSSTAEASSPSAPSSSPETSLSTTSASPVTEESSQTAPLTSPSSPLTSGPSTSPESSSDPTAPSSPSNGPETTEKQVETTVPDSGHPLIEPYLVLIAAIVLDVLVL